MLETGDDFAVDFDLYVGDRPLTTLLETSYDGAPNDGATPGRGERVVSDDAASVDPLAAHHVILEDLVGQSRPHRWVNDPVRRAQWMIVAQPSGVVASPLTLKLERHLGKSFTVSHRHKCRSFSHGLEDRSWLIGLRCHRMNDE